MKHASGKKLKKAECGSFFTSKRAIFLLLILGFAVVGLLFYLGSSETPLTTTPNTSLGSIRLVIVDAKELSDSYAFDVELQDKQGRVYDKDRFRWTKAERDGKERNHFTYAELANTASRFFLKRQGLVADKKSGGALWLPQGVTKISGGDDTVLPLVKRAKVMAGAKLEVQLFDINGVLKTLPPSGGDVLTISADADQRVYFDSYIPTTNCISTQTTLPVGWDGGDFTYRSMIRFPLSSIPKFSAITDADFQINVTTAQSTLLVNVQAYNQDGQADPMLDTSGACSNEWTGAGNDTTPYIYNDTTAFDATGLRPPSGGWDFGAAADRDIERANDAVNDRFSLAINDNDNTAGVIGYFEALENTGSNEPKLTVTYTQPTMGLRGSSTAQITSGTSHVVNVPAGVQNGDFMIAFLVHDTNTATVTAPNGWTAIGTKAGTTGSVSAYAYYRVASSEPASYTWTWDTAASATTATRGTIIAYYNTVSSLVFDTYAQSNFTVSTTHILTGVTTASANELLVGLWASDAQSSYSGYASPLSEDMDGAGISVTTAIASGLQVSAGASGSKSATTVNTDDGGGFLVAVVANSAPTISAGPSVSYGSFTRTGPNNTPYIVTFTATDAEQTGADALNWEVEHTSGCTLTPDASGTMTSGTSDVNNLAYNIYGSEGTTGFVLCAFDGVGGQSADAGFTLYRDDTAPSASTSISHSPNPVTSSKQYSVTFTPSDGLSTNSNEMAYQIRTASGGGGTLLTSGSTATSGTPITTATFTDSGLRGGISNTRYIRTRDGANNWTDTSFTVTMTNTAPTITVSPSASYGSYTRTGVNNTPYTVSFTATDSEDAGTNELTYYIHTGANRTGTQVATGTFTSGAATPTIAYNATGMVNGSNTLYLSVYDGALYSSGNPSFTVLRDDTAPTASTSISHSPATVTTSKQYTVTFTPNDAASTNTNEMAYEIRTASGGGGTLLTIGSTATNATPLTTGTITDSALVSGANTRYIRTRDGANNWTDTNFTVTVDLSAAPTVTTSAASSITSNEATLNGSANPNYAATTGWFRYSTTSPGTCNDSFGTRVPTSGGTSLGSGSSAVAYSQNLTQLSPSTTYYYCAIAQNSQGTGVGTVQSFTTTSAPGCSPPLGGNLTISTSCAFSNAVDGVDAGTGGVNTAILTIGAGKTLTIGNVANQKIAFGQITIQSGAAIVINKGVGASLVKLPLWAPQTDSDLDTYPGSIGNTYLAQSSEPNGYIRRNASSGVTLDCNDADADVYANQTVATDSDQDGYGTSAATSQCAGGSTTVGGRTYYKNSAGSYAFIASASMLGLEGFITSYDTPQSDIRAIINDTSNNVLYAGTYPNGIIYRCNFSGIADCDNPGIWTVSYDTTETGILSLIFDPINGVIYAGSDPNGIIYRCAVLTGCDEDTDWTVSYDTVQGYISSFVLDSSFSVLYAGTGPNGIIYRCALSTGCDASTDWTVSYDTTETNIRSLATFYYGGFNYIYAGSYSNGIIYRCVLSTGCNEATDWAVSYDTTEGEIYSITPMDSGGRLYAGTNPNGIIYRCDFWNTGCDASTDWTVSYDTTESNIYSILTIDAYDSMYAGTYPNGIIYRCEPTLGCDAAGDWTVSQDTPDSYIYSLFFEGASASIFAGTGGTGIIYRCESASGCQPE